jgi:hypothetical protein
MRTLLITYNLDGGDDQYKEVAIAIKAQGLTWHNRLTFDSVWWLKTESTSEQVREAIKSVFTSDDHLFVGEISTWNGSSMTPLANWLNDKKS